MYPVHPERVCSPVSGSKHDDMAQAELAAELAPSEGSLEVLRGRWWRKRWAKAKAEAAMEQLVKLLEVGLVRFFESFPSRSLRSKLVAQAL